MRVKLYTANWCPYCRNAKRLLEEKGVAYEEINIEEQGMTRQGLAELTGGYTVPQIIINDKPIGGFDKLLQLNQSGKLKELLANS